MRVSEKKLAKKTGRWKIGYGVNIIIDAEIRMVILSEQYRVQSLSVVVKSAETKYLKCVG